MSHSEWAAIRILPLWASMASSTITSTPPHWPISRSDQLLKIRAGPGPLGHVGRHVAAEAGTMARNHRLRFIRRQYHGFRASNVGRGLHRAFNLVVGQPAQAAGGRVRAFLRAASVSCQGGGLCSRAGRTRQTHNTKTARLMGVLCRKMTRPETCPNGHSSVY